MRHRKNFSALFFALVLAFLLAGSASAVVPLMAQAGETGGTVMAKPSKEPPTVLFAGLEHTPLGKARLAFRERPDGGADLVVSGLGRGGKEL